MVLALHCSSTEPHMCSMWQSPVMLLGREEGDTNSLEKVKYKILLPSSEHQQRLICEGKSFLCHLYREWIREAPRLEMAQTVPSSSGFSCTVLFF